MFDPAKISFSHVCDIKALILAFLVKRDQDPISAEKYF